VVIAFYGFGPAEIVLLLSVLLVMWAFWRIFSRAGFSGWLAVGMAVPLINLALLFYLAFAEWPALPRPNSRPGAQPLSEEPS
jgi:hypothetical protein